MALKLAFSLGALYVVNRLSTNYMEAEAELREQGAKKLVTLDPYIVHALEAGRSFAHLTEEGTRSDRAFFVTDPKIVQKLEHDRRLIIDWHKEAQEEVAKATPVASSEPPTKNDEQSSSSNN